ncbi:uncharacterized protein [Amphiura filiformis]|uniref:uncharacterized protein n=1 Tax=Amphiura filiformis TaxID=82378 RepID=UPI003B2280DC
MSALYDKDSNISREIVDHRISSTSELVFKPKVTSSPVKQSRDNGDHDHFDFDDRRQASFALLHDDMDEVENTDVTAEESNFTKCTVCTVTGEERSKTLNKEKRKAIEGVLTKHLNVAGNERRAYERHKEKSRGDNKYLCVSIDGMDQSKTTIPHLTRLDKGSQHSWRLQTHLTGAIIHGTMDYGKDVRIFVNTADIPSDSNLTLNILMLALEGYVKKHNKLPEVLYLQFDNCWRENKNIYVLGFCYLLVALGIVQKVRINFLIVGHTHNDVDQAFSRIAEALRKWVALTLDKLTDVIKRSYEKPVPEVTILNHLYDFREWLTPHFAGKFKNHSRPHNSV